ncbi:hypothetical protein ISN45_At03g011100 [Arabidopsis thaliana x Arabidopsis arenosa]|uniref:Phospholipid/glycerol acyltransferase domain-containing protein n=1 Tax=Arabidopsis thaliana x Arabidopsis arenosa TaxID=1240361 RepID=A0A8T2EKV1_9BRAS|nr:hypothetical protein ISN45_At03g011100 [Arabidopsis thaliana x Arabidopsis arenosa]
MGRGDGDASGYGRDRGSPRSILEPIMSSIHALVMHSQKIELEPVPVIFNDGRTTREAANTSHSSPHPHLDPIWNGSFSHPDPFRVHPPNVDQNSCHEYIGLPNHRQGKASSATRSRKLRVMAVVYSLSRFSKLVSPIPIVRIQRIRDVDAKTIKLELSKGDLVICPEGSTCRQPFLLRFSALFAELTDMIVPVAVNCRVGFFHANTVRGWNCMDMIFFFMNPRPGYEVTFLNKLPVEGGGHVFIREKAV